MVDTNELKRLMVDCCDQLEQILNECRESPENVRVVDVMGPMLQEFRELQEQVFYNVEQDERR